MKPKIAIHNFLHEKITFALLFLLFALASGCSRSEPLVKVANEQDDRVAIIDDVDIKGFERKKNISVLDARRIVDCYHNFVASEDAMKEIGGIRVDDVLILENNGNKVIIAFESKATLDLRVGYLYNDYNSTNATGKFLFSVNCEVDPKSRPRSGPK